MKEHLKPLLLIAQLLISIAVSACNPGNPTIQVSRARGKPVGILLLDFAERAPAWQLRSMGLTASSVTSTRTSV